MSVTIPRTRPHLAHLGTGPLEGLRIEADAELHALSTGPMNLNPKLPPAIPNLESTNGREIEGMLLYSREALDRIVSASMLVRNRLSHDLAIENRPALFRRLSTLFILAATLLPLSAVGADLKSETIQQWEDYIRIADGRNADHLSSGSAFLMSDKIAGQIAKLRSGTIVVTPVGPHVPLKIPFGLIHDWIGAAFIPNTSLADLRPVLRDYDRYKEFYHPNVVDSRRIGVTESQDQFSLVLVNKSVVSKTALETTYHTSYVQLDDRRCYGITDATRIREIADYETPSQHLLPENRGTGLIWRLHSISRFQERDGGVYIETEVIALSRDIPAALRWFIEPIVRRVSRSSLVTTFQQTEAAVRSHASVSTGWTAHRSEVPKERESVTRAGALRTNRDVQRNR